jgi:hypothetical protein
MGTRRQSQVAGYSIRKQAVRSLTVTSHHNAPELLSGDAAWRR